MSVAPESITSIGHVITLIAVSALLAVSTATGLQLLTWIGLSKLRALLMLPLSTALGAGAVAVLLLGVSVAGWLRSSVMAGVLLLLGLLVRHRLVEVPGLIRGVVRELMALVPGPLLGLFAGVGFLGLLLSLAPPTDYDSLMYHVDVPVEFLRVGRLHVPPDNLHVAQVGAAHLLYLPLIAVAGYAAPAALELAFAVLVGLVILGAVDELAGREAAAIAFVTLWGTTAFTLAAQTPKIDAALVLYLLAGQSLLMVTVTPARIRAALSAAGLLVGFGVGVKLHGALYAVALAPLAVSLGPAIRPGRARAVDLIVFLGGVVAGALPWLLKNGLLLGAPFYPLLANALPPPWLAASYGGASPLEASAPLAATALPRARNAINMLDLMVAPGRLTAEAEGRMYFLNPLMLAAPFAVFVLRDRRTLTFALPPLLYLAGLLVYSRHLNLRYLIPALIPLAALGATVAAALVRRSVVPARRTAALAMVSAAGLSLTLLALSWKLSVKDAPGYLLRNQPVAEYLQRADDYEIRSHINAVQRVNADLEPTSRVLMLFEGRGLYFHVPVLQDNVLTNWPFIVASGGVEDCLSRAGITHVLVGESTLRYFASRGLDPNDLAWGKFAAFKDRCLNTVYASRDYTLYRVAVEER